MFCVRANSLNLKYGSPRLIPSSFASVDMEHTHPSLLLNTTTGLCRRSGLNARSHETKNELQSMCTIIVVERLKFAWPSVLFYCRGYNSPYGNSSSAEISIGLNSGLDGISLILPP